MILYIDSINLYIPHAGLLHNFQGTVQNKNVGPFIHKLEGLSCDNLPLSPCYRGLFYLLSHSLRPGTVTEWTLTPVVFKSRPCSHLKQKATTVGGGETAESWPSCERLELE